MEEKGRSLGSRNQLRKKKTEKALPLGLVISFNDRDVHPHCPDASNPYHKCGRHCLLKIPSAKSFFHALTSEGGDGEGGKMMEGRGVNPNCPNASNPFHKCAEYCLERFPEKRGDAGKQPDVKPKEEKKAVVIADTGVNSVCKNASNPYHVCAEYCFQNVLKREQPRKQEKPKGVSLKSDTISAHPHQKQSSRPYHEDAEIYIKDTSEKEHCEGAMKPKPDNRTVVNTERGELSECKNASNLHHVCSENCFQALPEKVQCGNVIVKAKDDRKIAVSKERTMNLVCRNASNPYHVCAEYCFQKTESHQPRQGIMTSNEDKGVVAPPGRGVIQVCKNASNPYHVCAEYCFKNVPEKHKPVRATMKSKEEELIAETQSGVNLECKYASNPYHVCAEYCLQNAPERVKQRKVMKLRSQKQLNKTVSNVEMRRVHPQCRYASNPYHECADYCFQKNASVRHNPEAAMKPTERKKGNSHTLRRVVVRKCKNASNPPHTCSEYCSEEIREKNQAVEDIPVVIKDRRRKSSKKESGNHPMMENGNDVEAPKSNNNDVESSLEKVILQNGMEQCSMESKGVQEELSPNINETELREGITMQDGTEGLHSVEVVENKNRKEPADAQPLPMDASDLFQEWSKYCFQEKLSEGIIVMQDNKVERRKLSTANDKGNVVLKYQAKDGSPSSLQASVLLFVGFLFSMLYWTQVIHSLVMSSEKNKGRRRLTNKGHGVDAKCGNVSDPYHICSEYCSRGMGEGMH